MNNLLVVVSLLAALQAFAMEPHRWGLTLQLNRTIHIPRGERFAVVRDGTIRAETLNDIEGISKPYCAFENYKLSNMVLMAKSRLDIRFEKMQFPNESIVRYALHDALSSSIGLFCDFTGMPQFDPEKVVEYAAREFGELAQLVSIPVEKLAAQ